MAIINHSDATIASSALVRLGEKTISDLNDANDRARLVKGLYFQAKQFLLSTHPWQFASVLAEQLSRQTETPVTRWKYQFTLPPSRLSDDMRAVYSEASEGAQPLISGFAIQDQKLYSDFEAIYVDYVEEKSESLWPPYFSELMITYLMMIMAVPVTDQQNMADSAKEIVFGTPQKAGMFDTAKSLDGLGGEVQVIQDSPFIQARFAGVNGWS